MSLVGLKHLSSVTQNKDRVQSAKGHNAKLGTKRSSTGLRNGSLTLTERLNRVSDSNSNHEFVGQDHLSLSIQTQLHNLLNTPKGSIPINPDFGVDWAAWQNWLHAQEDISPFIADLSDYLMRYSKRFSLVEVRVSRGHAQYLVRFIITIEIDKQVTGEEFQGEYFANLRYDNTVEVMPV